MLQDMPNNALPKISTIDEPSRFDLMESKHTKTKLTEEMPCNTNTHTRPFPGFSLLGSNHHLQIIIRPIKHQPVIYEAEYEAI